MQIIFGNHVRYFDMDLMEHIRDRENNEAEMLISEAVKQYDITRLKDSSGSTLLHHAVREGNDAITAYLIKLGFNVNDLDDRGRTPLVLAVRGNYVSCTEFLLNANSNIRVIVEKGRSLVQSVFDGTIACYSHIIEMFMNKVVSEHNDAEAQARALIETKCPLYYVLDLRNIVITKAMLHQGCVVTDQEPKYGNSPLHRAVYFKDTETVKLLLANGADVNAKDKKGNIPWRCAPNLDGSIVDLRILKMLLDKKPELKSLAANQRMQMYELFVRGNEDAVGLIFKSGIDVSGKDGKGDTVFHYLAKNNNLSGSRLLEDNSYNVDSRNDGNLTALHVAATNGNIRAMMFLLNSGAKVDAKTRDRGLSPLMCAVRAKVDVKCVELLLERGADAQFTIQGDRTVLDMVRAREDDVAKTLLAHLAMLESRGMTIAPLVRAKIEGCEKYEKQFCWCKKQLDEMKNDKVGESLTLFEVLVEGKGNIGDHVLNKELKLKIGNQKINKNGRFDSYFHRMLEKRVKKAEMMVELFEWGGRMILFE